MAWRPGDLIIFLSGGRTAPAVNSASNPPIRHLLLVHHRQGRHLLGRPVGVALVGQHLVLRVDLGLVTLAVAREDVHDVRVAVAVGAAAEAVLPLVLVDLAGQQIRRGGKALVRLHDDLVAPRS